jgi:hypothetical protein
MSVLTYQVIAGTTAHATGITSFHTSSRLTGGTTVDSTEGYTATSSSVSSSEGQTDDTFVTAITNSGFLLKSVDGPFASFEWGSKETIISGKSGVSTSSKIVNLGDVVIDTVYEDTGTYKDSVTTVTIPAILPVIQTYASNTTIWRVTGTTGSKTAFSSQLSTRTFTQWSSSTVEALTTTTVAGSDGSTSYSSDGGPRYGTKYEIPQGVILYSLTEVPTRIFNAGDSDGFFTTFDQPFIYDGIYDTSSRTDEDQPYPVLNTTDATSSFNNSYTYVSRMGITAGTSIVTRTVAIAGNSTSVPTPTQTATLRVTTGYTTGLHVATFNNVFNARATTTANRTRSLATSTMMAMGLGGDGMTTLVASTNTTTITQISIQLSSLTSTYFRTGGSGTWDATRTTSWTSELEEGRGRTGRMSNYLIPTHPLSVNNNNWAMFYETRRMQGFVMPDDFTKPTVHPAVGVTWNGTANHIHPSVIGTTGRIGVLGTWSRVTGPASARTSESYAASKESVSRTTMSTKETVIGTAVSTVTVSNSDVMQYNTAFGTVPQGFFIDPDERNLSSGVTVFFPPGVFKTVREGEVSGFITITDPTTTSFTHAIAIHTRIGALKTEGEIFANGIERTVTYWLQEWDWWNEELIEMVYTDVIYTYISNDTFTTGHTYERASTTIY